MHLCIAYIMYIACRLATLKRVLTRGKTYILTRLKLVYSIVVVGMKMNDGLEGNARSGQPMLDTRSCSVQCLSTWGWMEGDKIHTYIRDWLASWLPKLINLPLLIWKQNMTSQKLLFSAHLLSKLWYEPVQVWKRDLCFEGGKQIYIYVNLCSSNY